MDVVVAEKRCTKCGATRPLSEFHRNRARPDGLADRCKECTVAKNKQAADARRAAMGDEAYRAYRREAVRRSRLNPAVQARDRSYSAAYNAALLALRDLHRSAFDRLLAAERYERGLD